MTEIEHSFKARLAGVADAVEARLAALLASATLPG